MYKLEQEIYFDLLSKMDDELIHSIIIHENIENYIDFKSSLMPENFINVLIKHKSKLLNKIPQLSLIQQFLLIKDNPDNIKLIINPDKHVQEKAVSLHPTSIRYIHNPDEDLQLMAIQKDADVIRYINNPTEASQTLAIRDSAYHIYIKLKILVIRHFC